MSAKLCVVLKKSSGSIVACFHSYVAPLDASRGGDGGDGAGRIVKS
jgi:hypothetical protein